jgi:hypothetical protein
MARDLAFDRRFARSEFGVGNGDEGEVLDCLREAALRKIKERKRSESLGKRKEKE